MLFQKDQISGLISLKIFNIALKKAVLAISFS